MNYATLDEFKLRLKGAYDQLTNRAGGTAADDAVGQAILDGAHALVHGYLASRYRVPIVTSSDATLAHALRDFVLSIAEFKAWSENSPREEVPQRVQRQFDEVMRTLRDIAAGRAILPGASEIPGSTAMGPSAATFGDDKVFTRDSLEGF